MAKHNEVVNSSLVASYSYDDVNYTLDITYKSNNHVWRYSPIYPNVFASVFNENGSIGSKVLKQIKTAMYQVRIQ